MRFSTLLALALHLLLIPVFAAPSPEPADEVAPAPACSGKRDDLMPAFDTEKRSCPYSNCNDCYNKLLSCQYCLNPVGCGGDNPAACTYCIAYCNANCC